jgi:hypothetical protein
MRCRASTFLTPPERRNATIRRRKPPAGRALSASCCVAARAFATSKAESRRKWAMAAFCSGTCRGPGKRISRRFGARQASSSSAKCCLSLCPALRAYRREPFRQGLALWRCSWACSTSLPNIARISTRSRVRRSRATSSTSLRSCLAPVARVRRWRENEGSRRRVSNRQRHMRLSDSPILGSRWRM